jgi:dipeptide/tripeptide permease
MDLSMGEIMVPVSALNIFDTLAILILVPLFDAYIYPTLKKRGYSCSMLTKIGCGLMFALLAMVVAGNSHTIKDIDFNMNAI